MPDPSCLPQHEPVCPIHKAAMTFVHVWDGHEWFECQLASASTPGKRCSCRIDYPKAAPDQEQP